MPFFFNDCQFLLYADDLKLYLRIKSIEDCIKLQKDTQILTKWCDDNKLELNIDKCKIFTFNLKFQTINYVYFLNGHVLQRVNKIKDLGVIFDNHLKFNFHIEDITNKSLRNLGFIIRNTKYFNNLNVIRYLYISIVRPKLEYCSEIWSPYYEKYIDQLENVQKKFVKYLCYKSNIEFHRCDYNQLLLKFNLESFKERRIKKDCFLTFKIINNLINSSTIISQLTINNPHYETRKCNLLCTKHYNTVTTYNSPINRMSNNFNNYPPNLNPYTIDTLKSLTLNKYKKLVGLAVESSENFL